MLAQRVGDNVSNLACKVVGVRSVFSARLHHLFRPPFLLWVLCRLRLVALNTSGWRAEIEH